MGIIVTAGVYFIFGLIVGVLGMAFSIGCIFYKYHEFNEPDSKKAVENLYVIGKKAYEIKNKH